MGTVLGISGRWAQTETRSPGLPTGQHSRNFAAMTGLAKTTRGPLFRQRERDPPRGAKILGIGTAQSARKEDVPIFSRISLNADAVAVRSLELVKKCRRGQAQAWLLTRSSILTHSWGKDSWNFLRFSHTPQFAQNSAEAQPRNLSSKTILPELRLAVYH